MAKTGYVALLRDNRDYRNLWLGQAISFAGDWFNLVALYAAVQDLTDSGRAVALVVVVKTLPAFLVTPIAGPMIDRFDRRRLLLLMDYARAALSLAVVASYLLGSLVGLYGCTVLMMLCGGIAYPTKDAVLPMVVSRDQIPAANALGGATWSAMLALGAAVGGATTAAIGITAALLIDGGTFLVSAWFFRRLPALQPAASKSAADTSLRAGLRYLGRHPYIAAAACLKPMMQLGGGALGLVALYGTTVFAGIKGPAFVGILYAFRGFGALVGSLVPRRFFGDRMSAMQWTIAGAFVLLAASYTVVGYSPGYWFAAVGFFLAAVGSATIWVTSSALLQLEADPAYHGRVFALEFGTSTLTLSIASYVAGHGVDLGHDVQDITLLFAGVSLLPAALWAAVLLTRRSGH